MVSYFAKLALKNEKTKKYALDIDDFIDYLTYCNKNPMYINYMHGLEYKSDSYEYYNRYSVRYFNQIYARLRGFENKFLNNLTCTVYIYFVTLTLPQRNISVYRGLINLRTSKKSFFHLLRNIRRDCRIKLNNSLIEYIWFIEPHKSGFPHLHLILFTDIKDFDNLYSKKLCLYWSESSGASLKHGFNIKYVGYCDPVDLSYIPDCELFSYTFDNSVLLDSDSDSDSDSISLNPSSNLNYSSNIQYLISYILKYMSKSLFSSIDLSTLIMHSQVYQFYKPEKRFREVRRMSDGSYRLRSLGSGAYRLWGYSRGLSVYLALDKVDEERTAGLNVLSVSVGKNTVWSSENSDLLLSMLNRYASASAAVDSHKPYLSL